MNLSTPERTSLFELYMAGQHALPEGAQFFLKRRQAWPFTPNANVVHAQLLADWIEAGQPSVCMQLNDDVRQERAAHTPQQAEWGHPAKEWAERALRLPGPIVQNVAAVMQEYAEMRVNEEHKRLGHVVASMKLNDPVEDLSAGRVSLGTAAGLLDMHMKQFGDQEAMSQTLVMSREALRNACDRLRVP